MLTDFHFKDFIPDAVLRHQANRTVDRLLELAPYGAVAVALVEPDGNQFRCKIEIYSKNGPFIAETTRPTAMQAVSQAGQALTAKLLRWQDLRYSKPHLADRYLLARNRA